MRETGQLKSLDVGSLSRGINVMKKASHQLSMALKIDGKGTIEAPRVITNENVRSRQPNRLLVVGKSQ